MRGKDQKFPAMKKETAAVAKEEVWEVRPGGMLVQKRSPESEPPPGGAPVPTIRVKVKYNGVYHEIYINSQASFGNARASPRRRRRASAASGFFFFWGRGVIRSSRC